MFLGGESVIDWQSRVSFTLGATISSATRTSTYVLLVAPLMPLVPTYYYCWRLTSLPLTPPRALWSNWTIAPISCCCLLPTIIFYAQCCSISLARQETEKGKVLGCWDENGIKIRISFSGQVNKGRDGWVGGCNRVGWDAVGGRYRRRCIMRGIWICQKFRRISRKCSWGLTGCSRYELHAARLRLPT